MPPLIGVALVAGAEAIGATAVAGALGATVLGTSVATIAGGAILTGALYGAERLLAQPRRQQAEQAKLPSGPVSFETEAQAIGGRFYTYGLDRLGGRFVFRESDGTTLGYGIVLNCRPIDAVVGYFVDDELLPLTSGACQQPTSGFGGTTAVTTVNFGPDVQWPAGGLKYAQIISYFYLPDPRGGGTQVPYVAGAGPCGFLEFRNATAAGVVSTLLQSAFPTLWDTTHKARGLTALYSIWRSYAIAGGRVAHYPRFYPIHSTVIRGARVFDPRDSAQSFLDPGTGAYSLYNATWKYSSNPALIIADYLTFPEGFGLRYSDIDWASVASAANACDALVDAFGGSLERFAQCHLTWEASEERRDVLNRILTACDGQIYEAPDGRVTLAIAAWEAPTVVFTNADISSIEAEAMDGVYAQTNYAQATYVEPRTNFSKNTSIVVTDDASIAAVGQRSATLDFSAVHSFSQAYRLATRTLRRKNTPEKLTITGGPRLLLADGERVVQILADVFDVSGVYRVMGMTAQSLSSVTLTLQLVTPDMFANAVPPFDPVNNTLIGVPMLAVTAPGAPTMSTTAANVTGTTTRSATITASATPPTGDTSSETRFRFRPVDPATLAPLGTGAWTVWTSAISQYAAVSYAIAGTAGVDQVFEIDAWMVSTQNIPGAFSASAFVTVHF